MSACVGSARNLRPNHDMFFLTARLATRRSPELPRGGGAFGGMVDRDSAGNDPSRRHLAGPAAGQTLQEFYRSAFTS
jgi:hypothetical protein